MQIYTPGTRIGQYEIASRPMMGGMGVVYFALDHGNDGRPVALKTFRPEFLPDRAARDRFLREGTAWVELGRHPHIVHCYSVEYHDPIAFLVLELIAKEQDMSDASLRSWLIPGQPLPIERALLFALQIARGMQYATEKIPGFAHRDLKPENILVGADKLPSTNINHLRVTDFGLVKTIFSGEMLAKAGNEEELKPNQVQFTRGAGTPLYMASEQWKGEPVGIFTDVYSFGCILYEMLSGQYAADGKTINELQVTHCAGKLRPIPASLPKEVVAIIAKCLATDSVNRYGTWDQISDELSLIYTSHEGQLFSQAIDPKLLSHREQVQNGWSYGAIGRAYIDISKPELAAGYFENALAISREADDRLGEIDALNGMGTVYAQLGEARQAISYFEQELIIMREIGNKEGETAALTNIGVTYAQLGDIKHAIDYFEQALTIIRKVGQRGVEGHILSNIGQSYSMFGDMQRAISYEEQALVIAREIGNRRGEAGSLGSLGIAYMSLGNTGKAIGCFELQFTIAHEIGDRRGEGNALGNLANAYFQLKALQQAIDYNEKALVVHREIVDRQQEANDLNNLGVIYKNLGDIRQAIDYYEQALAIAREINDLRGEGNFLVNEGNAYADLGDVQRAIDDYEKATVVLRQVGDLNGLASVLFNTARFYKQLGQTTRALPLAREAVKAWSQIGSPSTQRAQQLLALLQMGSTSSENNLTHSI
jgi:tetratricopeptide (TPR) repeat protein